MILLTDITPRVSNTHYIFKQYKCGMCWRYYFNVSHTYYISKQYKCTNSKPEITQPEDDPQTNNVLTKVSELCSPCVTPCVPMLCVSPCSTPSECAFLSAAAYVWRAALRGLLLHQDPPAGEGGGAGGADPHHVVAHALRQGGERPAWAPQSCQTWARRCKAHLFM